MLKAFSKRHEKVFGLWKNWGSLRRSTWWPHKWIITYGKCMWMLWSTRVKTTTRQCSLDTTKITEKSWKKKQTNSENAAVLLEITLKDFVALVTEQMVLYATTMHLKLNNHCMFEMQIVNVTLRFGGKYWISCVGILTIFIHKRPILVAQKYLDCCCCCSPVPWPGVC